MGDATGPRTLGRRTVSNDGSLGLRKGLGGQALSRHQGNYCGRCALSERGWIQWKSEKTFQPQMGDDARKQADLKWQRAVRATLAWAEDR